MKIFKPIYENLGEYKLDVSDAVEGFKKLTAGTQQYAGAVDKINAVIVKYNSTGSGYTAKIEASTAANVKIISTIKNINGVLTEESTRVKNLTQEYTALATAKEAANKRLVSKGVIQDSGIRGTPTTTSAGTDRLATSAINSTAIQILLEKFRKDAQANSLAQRISNNDPQTGTLGQARERAIAYRADADKNAAKEAVRIAEEARQKKEEIERNYQAYLKRIKEEEVTRVKEAEARKTRYFDEQSRLRNQLLLNANRQADAIEKARAYRAQAGTAVTPASTPSAPLQIRYTSQYQNAIVKANSDMVAARSATLGLVGAQNQLDASNKSILSSGSAKQQQFIGWSRVLKGHSNDVTQAAGAWKYWLRFVATQTIHKFIYDLINAARNGLSAITDLQVKISEIRTIGQERPLGFNQWITEIRTLSDVYGGTIEKVTEGVYQTISNQVAKGAEATRFMTDAMIFARTSVSTTDEAVNLLSSSLNAYGKSSQQATEDAASLFKTIEVGRVRANQIANSLGNVTVTAAEMGVNLDTVGAMLATMTIQGKNVDVSMTQIRNIMIKLLKPTEELGNYFKSIGQESGEAAVKAYGFTGLLQKINVEASKTGKGSTWLAKLFGDIRPIQGILSLTQDKMGQYNQILGEYQNKQAYYFKATQIAMESSGKSLQIELNRLRNYFVVDVAGSVLSTLNGLILRGEDGVAKVGGLLEAYKTLLSVLEKGAAAYIGYRVAVIASFTAELGFIRRVTQAHVLLNTMRAAKGLSEVSLFAVSAEMALKRLRNAFFALVNITNLLRVSIAGLVAITAYWAYNEIQAMLSINSKFQELLTTNRELDTVSNERHFNALKAIEDENNAITTQTDLIEQQYRQAAGDRVAGLNTNITDTTDSILSTNKVIGDTLNTAMTKIKDVIKVIDDEIKSISDKLQDIKKNATNITSGLASLGFYSKVIDSLGQVNDGHEKATRTLNQYYNLMRQGAVMPSTEALRSLPIKKDVKDVQGDAFKTSKKLKNEADLQATSFEIAQVNERMTAYQKFYALLRANANAAYASGNIEQGRAFTSEMLTLAEKLYDLGFTYNQVLDTRTTILQGQVNAEKNIASVEEARQKRLEKQKEIYTAVNESLNTIKEGLDNVKLNKTNLNDVKDTYKTAYADIKKTLESGAFDPKLRTQLLADLSTNKASFDQTSALQKSLADLDASTTSTIKDLDTSISAQLKLIADLNKAQLEKATIEEAIKTNSDAMEDTRKELEKASAARIAPLNTGMDLGTSAIEAFRKIANEKIQIGVEPVEQTPFGTMRNLVDKSFPVPITTELSKLVPGFEKVMQSVKADINDVNQKEVTDLIKKLNDAYAKIDVNTGTLSEQNKNITLQSDIGTVTKYLQSITKVQGTSETAKQDFRFYETVLKDQKAKLEIETKALIDLVKANKAKEAALPKDADGKPIPATDSAITKQLEKIQNLNKEMLKTNKEIAKSTDTTSTNVDKLANPMKAIMGKTKPADDWKKTIFGDTSFNKDAFGNRVTSNMGARDAFKMTPIGDIYKANVAAQKLQNEKLQRLSSSAANKMELEDIGTRWWGFHGDINARPDFMSSDIERSNRNTYAPEGETVVNVYLDGKVVGQEVISNISRGVKRGTYQLENNRNLKSGTAIYGQQSHRTRQW